MHDDFATCASQFPDPFRLLVRTSVTSTNDELRDLAKCGAEAGVVLLAQHQSAGRGRRGAPWFAAPGESLAFSVLLKPTEPKSLWPRLALAAGVAVAEAVESFGPAAGIKWPNDVWVGRRKIAGILVEAADDFAIVGIGLNVNTRSFPPEVADIATSLHLETDSPSPRQDVLAAVICRLAIRHRQIGVDFTNLLDAARTRCVLTGQRVTLLVGQETMEGTVEGIASSGELLLRTADGLTPLIQADAVRIVDAC